MKQLIPLLIILHGFAITLTAQLTEITPDDLIGGDFLGFFMAIEGDDLLVSASRAEVVPGIEGAIYHYVYNGSEWQINQKILPQFSEDESGFFADALALSDDWMLTSGQDINLVESVTIYRKNNGLWDRHSKITGANPDVGFGFDVALEGNTAVVGSILDVDLNGELSGVAYVYEYAEFEDQWELVQVLSPDGIEAGDFFGSHIYLEGDLLAVAARNDGDNGFQSGAVYLFEKEQGSWVESAKLTPADANDRNYIGYRIDGDGDRLIISV